MATFTEARKNADREVMVRLLNSLAENPEATQRDLATKLGISLGMMVSYMRSCTRKGYIRSTQVAPRRWAYFVTPKGFLEKSRMVSGYLSRALTFFRDTRLELEVLFRKCADSDIKNIAMVGVGDVSEVAFLVARGLDITLTVVSQTGNYIEKLHSFDAVLVVDVQNPQGIFDALKDHIKEERLLSIPALCIARKRINSARMLALEKETITSKT